MTGLQDRMANWRDGAAPGGVWLRRLGAAALVYLVLAVLVGAYWSLTPASFDVTER
ncbi:MAG TPA: DUF2333 domain-containing protein, partial [Halieaceae bacterium]|nr:DUF2333 domain-containing protein [Halieaceae bacterium]